MKWVSVFLCCFPAVAFAGLFDDDVARERIEQLRAQVGVLQNKMQTLETLQSGQIDQMNQINAVKQAVADLRGQIEVLTNEINEVKRREREYYTDLDTRLKRLENGEEEAHTASNEGQDAAKDSAVTPGEETANFDAALRLFEAGKYAASIKAFQNILDYYPNSALAPAAQFWIGNAYYAQQNNKSALAAYDKVVAKWPNNPKAAEAMLSSAKVYLDMKQSAKAKKELETLIAKYPSSSSASEGKKLLKTL